LLVALAQETGKLIPVLITEALDELQEHVHATRVQYHNHGKHGKQAAPVPVAPPRKKHSWEVAAELVQRFLKRPSRVSRLMGLRSMIITSMAPQNARYEAVLR
jgi:hypothetical protein